MEELVPLEVKNKKKFEKKVKGIQSMIKAGKVKPAAKTEKKDKKKFHQPRGVIYIGHIPHGFYEEQMRKFFRQFGTVTNVRVARSKKNGKSKGYAFVQFRDIEVAQIAAETMNNYLMDKRLLKAEYIPPERQNSTLFKGRNWIQDKFCPGIINKMKHKVVINKEQSDSECLVSARRTLKRITKLKESLKKIGIDYDFFQPCDIPPQLLEENSEKNLKTVKTEIEVPNVKNGDSKRAKKQNEKTKNPIVANPPEKAKKNKKVDARQRQLLTFKLDEENETESNQKKGKLPQKNQQEKTKIHKMQQFAGVTKQKEKQKNKQGTGKKNKK